VASKLSVLTAYEYMICFEIFDFERFLKAKEKDLIASIFAHARKAVQTVSLIFHVDC